MTQQRAHRGRSTRTALRAGLALLVAAGASLAGGAPASADPTCANTLGIAAHGQHVVGDYVIGLGHDQLGWPPGGGGVGATLAGEGAAVPGGPGPGFHFPNGFAPGASFCLTQSGSPGVHLGP
jgi:hypothetical protein